MTRKIEDVFGNCTALRGFSSWQRCQTGVMERKGLAWLHGVSEHLNWRGVGSFAWHGMEEMFKGSNGGLFVEYGNCLLALYGTELAHRSLCFKRSFFRRWTK
jgi:hypothetical protein